MTLIKSISGIRGTIGGKPGDSLSPVDIVKYASAFGNWLIQKKNKPKVVIGRDARPSGEIISELVSASLQSTGIEVIDLELTTTPTVEIAIPLENAGGGIMITASHNPIQWNALKLLNSAGEFISSADGMQVLEIAENNETEYVSVKKTGSRKKDQTYIQKHIDKILQLELVDARKIAEKNFRIAVDGINSGGGIAIPMLLEKLGVKQIEKINCNPDGMFQHNPEPLPENLSYISGIIEKGNFDLGIVTDPDVDRLCFLNEDGSMFGEEYTLVAIARYVLESNGGGTTVSNLSSTRALQDITEKCGGTYYAAAVGEVNVVEKMKATNAIIGGEGNGGIIYPALHYGRDALAGIALFLSYLAHSDKSISRLRATLPNYHISKNKIELTPDINVDKVLETIRNKYSKNPVNDIDGIKIEFEKEWVHLRKSNTEPIIRIYAESHTKSTAEYLGNKIISDIKEVINQNHH